MNGLYMWFTQPATDTAAIAEARREAGRTSEFASQVITIGYAVFPMTMNMIEK